MDKRSSVEESAMGVLRTACTRFGGSWAVEGPQGLTGSAACSVRDASSLGDGSGAFDTGSSVCIAGGGSVGGGGGSGGGASRPLVLTEAAQKAALRAALAASLMEEDDGDDSDGPQVVWEEDASYVL